MKEPHKTRVYIAGPYSKPDPCWNTNRMMAVWDKLMDQGFVPFCPLWSHFQHTFFPRPYEDWLAYDLEWIAVCDVMVRMIGESSGADREVEEARRLGIPVYYLDEAADVVALMSHTPRTMP